MRKNAKERKGSRTGKKKKKEREEKETSCEGTLTPFRFHSRGKRWGGEKTGKDFGGNIPESS